MPPVREARQTTTGNVALAKFCLVLYRRKGSNGTNSSIYV